MSKRRRMLLSRRHVLAAVSSVAILSVVEAGMAQAAKPRARISTELGDFVVEVDPVHAPLSSTNFLAYVSKGLLDGQSVYRIVSLANQPDTIKFKIEVIQFGWRGKDGEAPPLPVIAHEPTSASGLRHRDGTLSMARLAPGTAGPAFFICIGEQPSLDFGGGRNPDGQGFAAFGQVVEGMDVVRRVFAKAEATDQMKTPVRIERAALIAG